jgi:hypothetical protein
MTSKEIKVGVNMTVLTWIEQLQVMHHLPILPRADVVKR